MLMKLIETTVSETTIHMQLADTAELEKATQWVEFEVPLEGLMADNENQMGDPALRPLAIIQRGALHRVRVAIDEEMRRLSDRVNRGV